MLQPAEIGFEERSQIRNAIFQHREPIDAEPESVALIGLGIDAAHLEHARMDHARARDLEPIRAFPETDLSTRAVALDVNFDRWLGEREIGWPQAHPDARHFEERLEEFF